MSTRELLFWPKVNKDGPLWNGTPCWLWTGGTDGGQYGKFYNGLFMGQAHRFAYELLVGPIPVGLDIDHLCRNRPCVNPGHMEPVTRRTNTLRGDTIPSMNLLKTHCAQGHPYSLANTRMTTLNARECRTCKKEWNRRVTTKRQITRRTQWVV